MECIGKVLEVVLEHHTVLEIPLWLPHSQSRWRLAFLSQPRMRRQEAPHSRKSSRQWQSRSHSRPTPLIFPARPPKSSKIRIWDPRCILQCHDHRYYDYKWNISYGFRCQFLSLLMLCCRLREAARVFVYHRSDGRDLLLGCSCKYV
jgi:hypothetical protein